MEFYCSIAIDAPFEHRHQCWFCGEPISSAFTFPHLFKDKGYQYAFVVIDCPHPPLSVPCCKECHSFAFAAEVNSIWQVRFEVKKTLIQTYEKDLAIGNNWTQAELADSEFESGNFAGFQKSAWFMFEVAKQRVNFASWPIVLDGVYVEDTLTPPAFIFDGIIYPNIAEAVQYFCKIYFINKNLLVQVLDKLGIDHFGSAVRKCRLLIDATPDEQKLYLKSLSTRV